MCKIADCVFVGICGEVEMRYCGSLQTVREEVCPTAQFNETLKDLIEGAEQRGYDRAYDEIGVESVDCEDCVFSITQDPSDKLCENFTDCPSKEFSDSLKKYLCDTIRKTSMMALATGYVIDPQY